MNENLLQYAWQNKLFSMEGIQTVRGENVEIISVGHLNHDAGPDFFNAKIRVGSTLWAGNVEIHVRASDWYRHHHDTDKSYESVILHVVASSDQEIILPSGRVIPQIILPIYESLYEQYQSLCLSTSPIRCEKELNRITPELIRYQISRMVNTRLYRRAEELFLLLRRNHNDWEETLYLSLMRTAGTHTNALPFELLAHATPLKVIDKEKNYLSRLEALLLGQAGLLSSSIGEKYPQSLYQEYAYQKHKYNLVTMDGSLWKYSQMRPMNFPELRIAQMASLLHHTHHLFSYIKERPTLTQLHELFKSEPTEYWQTHFRLGKESKSRSKCWNEQTIDLFIINSIVPTLFAYGNRNEQERYVDYAYQLLEQIAPEENQLVKEWKKIGIEAQSAYESQGLIELRREYCEKNNCLRCSIGHQLLCRR